MIIGTPPLLHLLDNLSHSHSHHPLNIQCDDNLSKESDDQQMASCPISDIADFQSNVQSITYVLTSEGHCPLADQDDNSINGQLMITMISITIMTKISHPHLKDKAEMMCNKSQCHCHRHCEFPCSGLQCILFNVKDHGIIRSQDFFILGFFYPKMCSKSQLYCYIANSIALALKILKAKMYTYEMRQPNYGLNHSSWFCDDH